MKWRSAQRLTVTMRHVLGLGCALKLLAAVPTIESPDQAKAMARQVGRRALDREGREKFLERVAKDLPSADDTLR